MFQVVGVRMPPLLPPQPFRLIFVFMSQIQKKPLGEKPIGKQSNKG